MASSVRNVIVFGETGSGKSSVVNMLTGSQGAHVSSGATGCTFKSHAYPATLGGSQLKLFDTAGLNEGSHGTVSAAVAIANLYKLIHSLEDGVRLLVFCVRAPRIKETTVKNYRLFHTSFCQSEVPIVAMITGLEDEDPMDAWWAKNEVHFSDEGMVFDGHVCGVATLGKNDRYRAEYEETMTKLRDTVTALCLSEPWTAATSSWFSRVASFLADLLGIGSDRFHQICNALQEYAKLPKTEAKMLARAVVGHLWRGSQVEGWNVLNKI